jgi:hypothetical protein
VSRIAVVNRLLAPIIFVDAGLSAAQCGHAAQWLYRPPDVLLCGNAISDPYLLLVNLVAPLAAVANGALIWHGLRTRQWSIFTVTATFAFLATSCCLVFEGYVLQHDYGLPLDGVWWLPWP